MVVALGEQDFTVANKYKVLRLISHGSFGHVYEAVSTVSGEPVAIKLENTDVSSSIIYKSFRHEDGVGIPRIFWCGVDGDYNALVMELLGPSLEDIFQFCSRRFSLKTVLLMIEQMLNRVAFVHSQKLIHRDIKPENFMMGAGRHRNKVFLVDFGLAKHFVDPHTHKHRPVDAGQLLAGSTRYASLNAHKGLEQSRRDDLESLGYVFVYFMKGFLPWQGLTAATEKQKQDKIKEKKMAIPLKELCEGLPAEFAIYVSYCRELKYGEEPDYDYLRTLFHVLARMNKIRVKKSLGSENTFQYDYIFDWTKLGLEMERVPIASTRTSTIGAIVGEANYQ